MTTSYTEFIKDHLAPSPSGSEWVSVFIAPNQFNVMDLVRAVKAEGRLCQTLSSEHAARIGTKLLLEMAETFISHGVVVILQCQNEEDFLQFSKDIEDWKLRHVGADEKAESPRGRLWVLLNNTDQINLNPQIQRIADYACQV